MDDDGLLPYFSIAAAAHQPKHFVALLKLGHYGLDKKMSSFRMVNSM
jgi:hypothetical protein